MRQSEQDARKAKAALEADLRALEAKAKERAEKASRREENLINE